MCAATAETNNRRTAASVRVRRREHAWRDGTRVLPYWPREIQAVSGGPRPEGVPREDTCVEG